MCPCAAYCPPSSLCLHPRPLHSVSTGDYAYCTVIKALDAKNPRYRVLALSATPGTDVLKVQDVLVALHIAHIEVRRAPRAHRALSNALVW